MDISRRHHPATRPERARTAGRGYAQRRHRRRAATTRSLISMAFSGYLEQPDASPAIHQVLSSLADKGVVLIAAAGNDATDADIYPAAYDCVTGVGALA